MSTVAWLTELYMLSQGRASTQHQQPVLDAVLGHIVRGFGGINGCLAAQRRRGEPQLAIASVIDLPQEVVGQVIETGIGVMGQVLVNAKPVLINGDVRADQRFNDADNAPRRRPRSALCWPLVLEGQVIGLLSVNRDDSQPPFTANDLDLGSPVVALLALVVDNGLMHADLQDQVARLSAMNKEVQAVNRRLADAQHQLVQSEKMASIGQLAAGVAHEINNPIGYVSSNLQTLAGYTRELMGLLDLVSTHASLAPLVQRSGVDLPYLRQDLIDLLAESHQGLDRVKKIVQDLKDFSRVDQTEKWHGADLVACLISTLNIVNNELKYKATVEKDLPPLPEVQCLASQINQVFLNLLVNAGQAVAQDGHIGLRCGHVPGDNGGSVWFEIEDNGCGIAPDDLSRIFEPFFTTKPVGQGTGLGLSLSYSIMQKHHGRLEVDSALGRGSRFRMVMPVRQASPLAELVQ